MPVVVALAIVVLVGSVIAGGAVWFVSQDPAASIAVYTAGVATVGVAPVILQALRDRAQLWFTVDLELDRRPGRGVDPPTPCQPGPAGRQG